MLCLDSKKGEGYCPHKYRCDSQADRSQVVKFGVKQMQTTQGQARFGGHRGGNILEFYTEEFRPEPSPVEVFRQHVIQWFFAVKHLRFFETNRLTDQPALEDLASHRMVCSALITFGEFASNFARRCKPEVNLAAMGLSVESIEAETRLLRNNFKMFHDNTISYAEADAVLKEAFNEA